MKKNYRSQIIILITGILLISCNQNTESQLRNESKFSELKGPYLGQNPPGMQAELFAPELLKVPGHYASITFSPDGSTFSSTIYTEAGRWLVDPKGPFKQRFMMYSRLKNGRWTEPKEFSFTPGRRAQYFYFSPDGKNVFFNSTKNMTDPPDKRSSFIWHSEKLPGDWEWSKPKQIDFGENYYDESGLGCIYPTVALNGNMYFFKCPNRMTGVLYMSKYENGKYLAPEKLNGALHGIDGAHPFIAPDESYIIFDYGDLFISFQDENGIWQEPINMGENVNTVYDERRAFVSFDGKYLFFASDRVDPDLPDRPLSLRELQQLTSVHKNGFHRVYWIDAKIIEELRPKNINI